MFKHIHLTNLQNNEFIQFVINYLEILSENDLVALKLQSQTDNLSDILVSMIDLYEPENGSLLTKTLQKDDARRYKGFIGIQSVINAYTYHFDAGIKESADVLVASLKKYGTGVSKQNYLSETATFDSILEEWKKEEVVVNAIRKLELTDWVIELGTANRQFNTDYFDCVKEDAESSEIKIIDLRKQVTQAYRELRNRLNAFAIIGEVEAYFKMIKQGNNLIEKFNAIVKVRVAKEILEVSVLE